MYSEHFVSQERNRLIDRIGALRVPQNSACKPNLVFQHSWRGENSNCH